MQHVSSSRTIQAPASDVWTLISKPFRFRSPMPEYRQTRTNGEGAMSWDDYADEWDQDEAARAYSVAVFDCLTELAETRGVPLAGARVLDFGCGTGLLTEKVAPLCAAVLAVDTSARMIEHLQQKSERLGLTNVTTSTTKAEHLSQQQPALVEGGFDFVVCSSVCAFVDDYPGTVRSLVSLLKAGGIFVQWDWELDPEAEEPYGLTRGQITEALAGSGLRATRVDTAFEVSFGEMTMRPLMGAGQKASSLTEVV